MTVIKNRWIALYPILAAFVILAVIYAWATPIFEASDELWHFGMVHIIADTGQLPVQDPAADETVYRQEGSQPPLYYLLSALLVQLFNRDDFEDLTLPNPHPQTGIPGSVGNKNMVLHDDLAVTFSGSSGAVYLLRGLGILLGCVTIFSVYAAARQLGGNAYAAFAAGLTAFNPMFLFITASVNNDNMVTALNSLIIWQIVVMLWSGLRWQRSLFISILITLASLSKLSGNVLVPGIVLVALYLARRDGRWKQFILLGFMMAFIWAGFSGWWYVRNILLYGELFGTHMMVEIAGSRMEPFTWQTLVNEFEGFRISYWGLFGGVNILTFQWFYWLMDAFTVLAVAGLLISMREVTGYLWRGFRRYGRLLGIHDTLNFYWWLNVIFFCFLFVVASISLITWTAQTYASQGRLLFPFVAANSLLLSSGFLYLFRARWKRIVITGALTSLFAVALFIPFVSIRPAYSPPKAISVFPEGVRPVYARFDDVELVGYSTPAKRYAPGDAVDMTVYWRVIEPSSRDLSAYLVAVDPQGNDVGKVDTYPGGGALRTSTWEPGTIIPDRYAIPLDNDIDEPFNLRIQVGWWHYPSEEIIQAVDEGGISLSSVMLDVGAVSPDDLVYNGFAEIDPVEFGQQIALVGQNIQDQDSVSLLWEAVGNPPDNYTVFVQVLDLDGQVVGQGDMPPPMATSYWRRGDVFKTEHTIYYQNPLEPGTYRIIAGWYHPVDFSRLELNNSPDNAYLLGEFNFP